MKGEEPLSLEIGASVSSAMHGLAAAIRRRERDSFERSFNLVLRAIPVLRAAWLKLSGGPGTPSAVELDTAALSFPVTVGRELVGTLHQRIDRDPVGETEIRLLAATADLVGSVLGAYQTTARSDDVVRVLQVALDQLPAAVVCLGREGGLLCFNERAGRLAGSCGGRAALASLFSGALATGDERGRLVALGERTALASVHMVPPESAALCSAVITLVDVSERVGEYRLAIEREMFRALWLAQPLTLAVFMAPGRFADLLALADEQVAVLPGCCARGLVNSTACGVLFRGRTAREMRAELARLTPLRSVHGLRVGVAEVRRDAATVDALVRDALASIGATSMLPKPRVLLWDSSASVTEALCLALRDVCEAIPCHERGECLRRLRVDVADGVFAKVDVDEWEADINVLRRIVKHHPGVVAFVLTDLPGPYQQLCETVGATLDVFRKPFSFRDVRAAVVTRLSA